MNNILISDSLDVNKKEKKYNKILLIISFLIGIIGLVIIMRLVEVSFPNKNSILVYKNDTLPVLEYYKKLNKLFTVDGMQNVEGVSKDIQNLLC